MLPTYVLRKLKDQRMATGRHLLADLPSRKFGADRPRGLANGSPGNQPLSLRLSIFSPPYLASSDFITVTFLPSCHALSYRSSADF
jgi:hypothetical protein